MDNFQLSAILAVVILQGAEAVGALGDNLFYAFILEHLDILLDQTVEHELVTQAAQAVSAAVFVSAQNTPGNTGRVHNLACCQGHLFAAGVVSAGAAYPEQVFGLAGFERFNVNLCCPLGAVSGSNTPGITALLYVLKKAGQFLGEL
jgi:hypothetical protein